MTGSEGLAAAFPLGEPFARLAFIIVISIGQFLWPSAARGESVLIPGDSAEPIFQIAGKTFHLDPLLLEAIAQVESDGRPGAVSPKGASGLMQLMPETAKRFGVKDPFNPVDNVVGAARFLSYLRDDADIADLPQLLAAYDAGEGAVQRYRGIPPYPETRKYVRRVLLTYLLGDDPSTAPNRLVPPYPRKALPVARPGRHMILPQTRSRVRPVVSLDSETDLFVRLDQIRRARAHAEKLDHELK